MWHHYMTSFRRVFVLLVIAFATDATPTLVFKSFDDFFTGHRIFIHTNTHHVKVNEKWGQLQNRIAITRNSGLASSM